MLSPLIIIVNVIVRLATVCMLILRKCANYVIIIHTGHGDFGDKDIVHQAKGTVCCVCTEEFNVDPRGILERQCFPLGVKAWLFLKSRSRA